MAAIGHKLMIKYGLGHTPDEFECRAWVRETKNLVQAGISPEAAGRRAAQNLFSDYETHKYASEADTVEALLRDLLNG